MTLWVIVGKMSLKNSLFTIWVNSPQITCPLSTQSHKQYRRKLHWEGTLPVVAHSSVGLTQMTRARHCLVMEQATMSQSSYFKSFQSNLIWVEFVCFPGWASPLYLLLKQYTRWYNQEENVQNQPSFPGLILYFERTWLKKTLWQ